MIWGTISVGIVMLLQWVKGLIKADVPVLSFFLAFALNGLSVWLVSKLLGMVWDWATFWPVIKDAALVSIGTHILVKTADKQGVAVPLMTNKNNHTS